MSLLPELNPNLIQSNLAGRLIGTLQNPVTSGLEFQAAAFQEAKSKAQLVTVDGANLVSNWTDLSANDNDAAQGTAANQPLYVSNGINGFPALDFTNVTAPFLTLGTRVSLTNCTVISTFVSTGGASSTGQILADSTVNNQLMRFDPVIASNGSILTFDGTDIGRFDFTSPSTGIPVIFRSEFEVAVNQRMSINGFLKETATYDGTIQADQIGRLTTDSVTNMGGKLGELIVYNRILTAAEILKVEQYLSIKWRIPLVDLS